MAPEILHFHKYDAKADLWSTGAILYELVGGWCERAGRRVMWAGEGNGRARHLAGCPCQPRALRPPQVVGRPPFTGANQFQLLRNIERSEARLPEAIAAQLSPQCRHARGPCGGAHCATLPCSECLSPTGPSLSVAGT